MTEFMCFILFANRFFNKVLNGIKKVSQRCYCFFILLKNVFIPFFNLVEKPVGEQDKTNEFSHRVFSDPGDKVLFHLLRLDVKS